MNERNALTRSPGVLFLYVLAMRTYDVASDIPDARRADARLDDRAWQHHRPAADRRASTAGGRGLGPVYYWLLWIGRVAIGPFHGQPAACRGGIIVALLQSIADVWLLHRVVAADALGAWRWRCAC